MSSEETKKTENKVVKTAAEKIWDEIKDKKIEMFSLPSQTVSSHCNPVTVEPTKLYLQYKASSLIASLESSLGEKYKVEMSGRFITVSKP
jgi:hypothetical protein